MSWAYKDAVDAFEVILDGIDGQTDWMTSRIDQARDHYDLNQDHFAIDDLIEAVGFSRNILIGLVYDLTGGYHYPLIKIMKLDWEYTNETLPEADISLLKMIDAFIDAHDDHRSGWQLLTDAYKASMYDKPFNLEYHTGWVARFRSWA